MNGVSLPGLDFCLGISRALEVAPELVLRHAGLLPPEPAPVAEEREIMAILREQPPPVRRTLLQMLRGLARRPPPPIDAEAAELAAIYERLDADWRPELVRAARMFELNARAGEPRIIGEEESERERERAPSATE